MTGADQHELTASQNERCNGREKRGANDSEPVQWKGSKENEQFSQGGVSFSLDQPSNG